MVSGYFMVSGVEDIALTVKRFGWLLKCSFQLIIISCWLVLDSGNIIKQRNTDIFHHFLKLLYSA